VILLRSLLFNLVFYVWMAILGTVSLPVLLLPRRFAWAVGRLYVRQMMVLLRNLVGLDYRVIGAAHLPHGAAIVAMKHQSAWETLILPLLFADPAVVLKRELLLLPFFGWWQMKLGMIAVDRGAGARALKQIVAQARDRLAQGRTIVIFPQGTRTPPGARRPYQPGLAALYLQLGVPVVPVALNSGLFWRRRSCLRLPGTMTIEFLPPIAPGLARAAFEAALEQAIEAATARLEHEEGGDKTALERAESRG
jgi:1-acyl-sn-glycerol-3-phosphate acyltransferase